MRGCGCDVLYGKDRWFHSYARGDDETKKDAIDDVDVDGTS